MLFRSFVSATTFLTAVPFGGSIVLGTNDISYSRAFYPLVGLLIGLFLLILEKVVALFLPELVNAGILLFSLLIITRGLHLDGFMDVCDGLFGGFTRERRLEIMRDPHVGSFAVAGCSCLLLLKFALLVAVCGMPTSDKSSSLLLFPVVSRWAMVISLQCFPYIRREGLGSAFHGDKTKTWVASAFAFATATIVSVMLFGWLGSILLIVMSCVALLIGWYVTRVLGGLTGDVYGATNETIEVVCLISLVLLVPFGFFKSLEIVVW